MKDVARILTNQVLDDFGIGEYGYFESSASLSFERFSTWVDGDSRDTLPYLKDHRKDLRSDLKKVFPKFESGICFLFPYFKDRDEMRSFYQSEMSNGLKVASYAMAFDGVDYHFELKERLEKLSKILSEKETFIALDTAPVLDRELAYRAGLGWFGKNSMLINRHLGSFFLIGTILFKEKFEALEKKLETDHCGQCQACVIDCPTNAIDPETRTLNSGLCLSTHTIEFFDPDINFPKGHPDKSQGEVFGCDICQDVCPWNKRHEQDLPPRFEENSLRSKIKEEFLIKKPIEISDTLAAKSNKSFAKEYKFSPIGRTGRKRLKKNVDQFIKDSDS